MQLGNVIAKPQNKTIYRDGDKVVKVFDLCYDKADVLNEALNQSRVEKSQLHIPRVHGVECFDGKWAIISDFISGDTMDSLLTRYPEKRLELLTQFVELHRLVHSQTIPMLARFKDKLNFKISQGELDVSLRYQLHTRLDSMPTHTKLCHGDFNPKNIVITPDGTPFILDWAHASLGNASADVAQTYLLFCLSGHPEDGERYLSLFCKTNDVAKRYVTKWIPIVAASRLTHAAPEEQEFLLQWAQKVMD